MLRPPATIHQLYPPELVVCRHGRELHVALLRNGARAGNVGRHAGDAFDLFGRDERAL